MAKGFTPDQLHQELASSGVQDYGQGQANPHSGNWFTHLLPTVGGVLGSIGGGLLTAGMGGEFAGGAGGAALGKALENKLEGKNPISADDLTAGLEGGIGAGVGSVAGKALGALGGVAGRMAENKVASAASDKAIGDIAQAYGDVPKPLQTLYNANDSLGHVKAMGFDPANPENLITVGNTSNDVLNEALNNSLAKSPAVDLGHYNDLVHSALSEADPNGGLLGSLEGTPLARGGYSAPNSPAAKLVQQLQNMGAGVAKGSSDPNEVRTLVDNLTQLSQKLTPKVNATTGAFDPAQEAAYNLVNNVRNQVSNSLYDRPEVNLALKGQLGNLTPEDVGGSQALADHLNGVLTKAGTGTNTPAQDLLSEIERNNNIAALGNEGQKAQQIVTSPTAQARQATAAGVNTTPAGNGLNTTVNGALAGHSLLSGVASHGILPTVMGAAKAGSKIVNDPKLLSTMGRIGEVLSKGAPAGGVVMATAPNMGAAPIGHEPGDVNMQGGTVMNNQPGQYPGGNNGGSLLGGILNRYMYMGNVDPYLLGSTSPVVQALAPTVQKQSMLSNELSALPASYDNAGGAQGLEGILSQISGLIPGTAAHNFQAQRGAAAQALASQLGISPGAASGLLPSLMQNQNTAGINSGILGQLGGQLAY
jgi:hypothetical protein